MRDVEVIELELALADLQQVEKRMERAGKDKKTGKAPYYAKRSVLKGAVAQDRFADLKNRGKLGAFLAKRGRRAGLLEKGARKQGNDPAR